MALQKEGAFDRQWCHTKQQRRHIDLTDLEDDDGEFDETYA